MRFVHIATRTKDLEAALAFYQALGLRVQRTSELKKAKATLVFITPPEENFAIELVYNWGKDDGYEGGTRFGHFAFDVVSIDALLPALTAAGGTVLREPYLLEGTGPKIAFVSDPDGNQVELIER
jgi:lactoylglutathione lyase